MDRLASAAERLRAALERRPEIVFAYIFGSTATGRRHRHSDVDIGVLVEHRLADAAEERAGWGGYLTTLTNVAMAALESDEVQVVMLDAAPPLLADRVARRGYLVFSRDEPRRLRWLVETKSRYCDLRPYRELLRHALTRRVRSGRFGTARG